MLFSQVGWYNETVGESFRLQYDDDTIAVLLVSTPDMFEKVFLPFVRSGDLRDVVRDPLDQSISNFVQQLTQVSTVIILTRLQVNPVKRDVGGF